MNLVPGTLVSENEMASIFSISRTPVRDAFKVLVNEGLLEVKSHIYIKTKEKGQSHKLLSNHI